MDGVPSRNPPLTHPFLRRPEPPTVRGVRLQLDLDPTTEDALARLAAREYRPVRLQAQLLLNKALKEAGLIPVPSDRDRKEARER